MVTKWLGHLQWTTMLAPSQPHSTFASSDPGFEALPLDDLLSQHDDLIVRIKLCHGSDRADFEQTIMSLIRRYASLVHLLPATSDNYFCIPGGLLRLGMEVSFFSLQGTDAHIFSGRSTISARRHLEPRWRLATFVAGLCCEAHRVLSHIIVTDAPDEVWPAYLLPLSDWLIARQAGRYFLRWRPQAIETRSLGVFTLAHVVPPAVMHFLAEDNTVIVPHLMASVSGISQYRDHNVLDELVRRSLALVIDRNLLANADRYGTPQYGSHLERYLVDALRHLAGSNAGWQANREKSRVWFGPDGLFLAWPSAAEDIQKLLDTAQLPGIPKAPETIMEVLMLAGVFEPTSAGNSTWLIQPPGGKAKIEAVKLSSTAILFAGHDPLPPPLAESLTSSPRQNPPSAQAAEPVAPPPLPDGPPGTQLSLIPGNSGQTHQAASHRQDAQAEAALLSTAPPSALASTSDTQTTQQATIGLQAPLRLNPVVRDALTEVVNTLNTGTGPAQCCTVALGVFVPLHEFERRGIQPSVALRALSDVHMLIRAKEKGPPTTSRDFNGTSTVGLTIAPRFINGVDMEAFASPEAKGG
ncbi:MobH family relaxase [Aquabacterium sp. NJ1]|uniref:MobH family relaxase n=1 Tax=Aquabacterium sp. NJ1 TaxID=1538295 RepID=UPI0009DCFE51